MNNNNKILCCYHHPCLDGSTSAWIFKKAFGNNIQFLGVDHLPYDRILDKINKFDFDIIYFLDFSPELAIAKELLEKQNKQVIIWDHHISSFNRFKEYRHDNLEFIFSPDQSGAGITWGNTFPNKQAPDFVRLVEDIDLRRITLCKDNEDMHFDAAAYIDNLDLTYLDKTFKTLDEISKLEISEIARLGRSLRQEQLLKINNTMNELHFVQSDMHPDIRSHDIPMVYCNIKETGRELDYILLQSCKTVNVAFIYFEERDYIRLHIRTDGITPANEIAHSFLKAHGINGGGHLNSAVVRMTKENFNTLFKK